MTNILEDGRLAIRVPRVVVPDKCIERCSQLKEKVGQALGQAAAEGLTAFPAQRAVVCDKAARIICHARVISEGYIESDIIAGGSPNRLSASLATPSPSQIIEAAIDNGAVAHSVTEVFEDK